jgi:hypothetical protein
VLVAGCIVLFLAVGGAAGAFWRASGNGSGTGAAGTTVPVTLSAGVPTGDLFPGGRADVLLTATNPNTSAVRVGALVLDTAQGVGGFAVDSGHSGCGVSAMGYARQANGGVGWTIPARGGSVDGTLVIRLPNALTMSLDAANACQGARITVYLAVSP